MRPSVRLESARGGKRTCTMAFICHRSDSATFLMLIVARSSGRRANIIRNIISAVGQSTPETTTTYPGYYQETFPDDQAVSCGLIVQNIYIVC